MIGSWRPPALTLASIATPLPAGTQRVPAAAMGGGGGGKGSYGSGSPWHSGWQGGWRDDTWSTGGKKGGKDTRGGKGASPSISIAAALSKMNEAVMEQQQISAWQSMLASTPSLQLASLVGAPGAATCSSGATTAPAAPVPQLHPVLGAPSAANGCASTTQQQPQAEAIHVTVNRLVQQKLDERDKAEKERQKDDLIADQAAQLARLHSPALGRTSPGQDRGRSNATRREPTPHTRSPSARSICSEAEQDESDVSDSVRRLLERQRQLERDLAKERNLRLAAERASRDATHETRDQDDLGTPGKDPARALAGATLRRNLDTMLAGASFGDRVMKRRPTAHTQAERGLRGFSVPSRGKAGATEAAPEGRTQTRPDATLPVATSPRSPPGRLGSLDGDRATAAAETGRPTSGADAETVADDEETADDLADDDAGPIQTISPEVDAAFRKWLGRKGAIKAPMTTEAWRSATEGRWGTPIWRDMAKEKGIPKAETLTRKCALDALVQTWHDGLAAPRTPDGR